ncbi:Uncharacterized protein dnm_048050 [Desulfonema magnum]|uniref:Uncharacterized protein n=1 Tax=Desulfonema magnum TaxID=45655 RepID=A0A975BP38_9BACT|nr:Uncharacterized protein dnm_048050 [Desulfonema magnum]
MFPYWKIITFCKKLQGSQIRIWLPCPFLFLYTESQAEKLKISAFSTFNSQFSIFY